MLSHFKLSKVISNQFTFSLLVFSSFSLLVLWSKQPYATVRCWPCLFFWYSWYTQSSSTSCFVKEIFKGSIIIRNGAQWRGEYETEVVWANVGDKLLVDEGTHKKKKKKKNREKKNTQKRKRKLKILLLSHKVCDCKFFFHSFSPCHESWSKRSQRLISFLTLKWVHCCRKITKTKRHIEAFVQASLNHRFCTFLVN